MITEFQALESSMLFSNDYLFFRLADDNDDHDDGDEGDDRDGGDDDDDDQDAGGAMEGKMHE